MRLPESIREPGMIQNALTGVAVLAAAGACALGKPQESGAQRVIPEGPLPTMPEDSAIKDANLPILISSVGNRALSLEAFTDSNTSSSVPMASSSVILDGKKTEPVTQEEARKYIPLMRQEAKNSPCKDYTFRILPASQMTMRKPSDGSIFVAAGSASKGNCQINLHNTKVAGAEGDSGFCGLLLHESKHVEGFEADDPAAGDPNHERLPGKLMSQEVPENYPACVKITIDKERRSIRYLVKKAAGSIPRYVKSVEQTGEFPECELYKTKKSDRRRNRMLCYLEEDINKPPIYPRIITILSNYTRDGKVQFRHKRISAKKAFKYINRGFSS